ncbi:hypothetical protein CRG98_021226 [Punica granatum]|uniref:Uncharacterized protein n=1 Tax=Punica granatum TaxID=22663 RepID=A0A2I0JR42_PUNGR|nr:hypothetical protein CRG98_021226 [Punica granatum]
MEGSDRSRNRAVMMASMSREGLNLTIWVEFGRLGSMVVECKRAEPRPNIASSSLARLSTRGLELGPALVQA